MCTPVRRAVSARALFLTLSSFTVPVFTFPVLVFTHLLKAPLLSPTPPPPSSKQHQAGFTLLELLIALTLIGILVTTAIPGFNHAMQRNQANTSIARLQAAINTARQQAILLNQPVTICAPNAQMDNCNGQADWSNGIAVFTQAQVTETPSGAPNSQANTLILREQLFRDATVALNTRQSAITFTADGLTNNPGTVRYCPEQSAYHNYARALVISFTGRVRQTEGASRCQS